MSLMRFQVSSVRLRIDKVSWLVARAISGTTISSSKAHEISAFSKTEIHPAPIRTKWVEHQSGYHDHTASLWNVLMFQAWLEEVS